MNKLFVVSMIALGVSTAGCYSTAQIKPGELPKLNGAAVGTIVAGPQSGQAIAVSVGHVEGIDGRMVEVKGEHDATVVQRNGARTTFEHPVWATATEETLEVRGGNRASTSFSLADVSSVETKSYNGTATMWAVTGVALAITVAVLIATVVVISDAQPDYDY